MEACLTSGEMLGLEVKGRDIEAHTCCLEYGQKRLFFQKAKQNCDRTLIIHSYLSQKTLTGMGM